MHKLTFDEYEVKMKHEQTTKHNIMNIQLTEQEQIIANDIFDAYRKEIEATSELFKKGLITYSEWVKRNAKSIDETSKDLGNFMFNLMFNNHNG